MLALGNWPEEPAGGGGGVDFCVGFVSRLIAGVMSFSIAWTSGPCDAALRAVGCDVVVRAWFVDSGLVRLWMVLWGDGEH